MTITTVIYRYTDDVAARDRLLAEHRNYLRGLAERGVLLVSGPFGSDEPRGALLLFRAGKDEASALLGEDPFAGKGVIAHTEITTWEPVIGPLVAALRQ